MISRGYWSSFSLLAAAVILAPGVQPSNLLLAPSGPTCTVTSVIPGNPTSTLTSMKGSCSPALSCRALGGVPIGKCGITNVCCVYPRSCESKTNQNQTYFTNPGYPSSYNGTLSCTLNVQRAVSPYRVCQIRLDFIDMELNPPFDGECITDRFVVSGQNANSIVPSICGRNTGQHIYMDVDGAQGPFSLRVITSGTGLRRWNVQVSQIECANPSRAPANCLQYYMGPAGSFQSFNYESTRIINPQIQQQQVQGSGFNNPFREASYFNSLDYSICFRKEVGFCTQTYTVNNSTFNPAFDINIQLIGGGTPSGQQGIGVGFASAGRCVVDYLVLNGVRYCGQRLAIGAISQNSEINTPIIDRGSGPFMARFVSNERYVGRGFRLNFQQNPCGSRLPIEIAQIGLPG